jgi:hypothetical protein
MKPMGLRPLRFPSKTKEWFGKGVQMWWEAISTASKKRDRQQAKIEIKRGEK